MLSRRSGSPSLKESTKSLISNEPAAKRGPDPRSILVKKGLLAIGAFCLVLFFMGGSNDSSDPITMTADGKRVRVTKPPPGTQMGQTQVNNILKALGPDGNLLVWGLGNDSPFWHDSTTGKVVFLEDDIPQEKYGILWYDVITKKHPFLKACKMHYSTQTKDSYTKYMDASTDVMVADLDLSSQLPEDVQSIKWDVIIVDAPQGSWNMGPGRYQSIYTSYALAKKHGTKYIFIDDYERKVERKFSLKVFGKEPFRVLRRGFKWGALPNQQAQFNLNWKKSESR